MIHLTKTDLPALMSPVDTYSVARSESNIAPTAGSAITGGVKVYGKPRKTQGHPCTIWDKEDIAHYQSMLKTSPELKAQLDGLIQGMDKRMTQPVGVPPAQKDENGNWRHFSDVASFNGGTYGKAHNQLSLDIANLATVYALTGEAKYAEFAKKILLDYAEAYPNPSSSNVVLSIRHPGLAGKTAYRLDPESRRLGEVEGVKVSLGTVELMLQGAAQVEFAASGVMGLHESRQALLERRRADQEAANHAARHACAKRTAKREAEAKASPVPVGTIAVLNAAMMSTEGGGNVKITTTKRAAVGSAFSGWDSIGHWIEWKFIVPAEGYYPHSSPFFIKTL